MIEHSTRETEAGTLFCPRLVCDACGDKIRQVIDAYVFVQEGFEALSTFVHKRCLELIVFEADPDDGLVIEEASIFLHRLLCNVGEEVAAENIGLIRECRIIGRDYEGIIGED